MGLEVLVADALAGGIGEAVAGDVLGGALLGFILGWGAYILLTLVVSLQESNFRKG